MKCLRVGRQAATRVAALRQERDGKAQRGKAQSKQPGAAGTKPECRQTNWGQTNYAKNCTPLFRLLAYVFLHSPKAQAGPGEPIGGRCSAESGRFFHQNQLSQRPPNRRQQLFGRTAFVNHL